MKNKLTLFKAPMPLPSRKKYGELLLNVFLAGSIENGTASNWQENVTDKLKLIDFDINVFNPRRDNWDSSWEQSINNNEFKSQVVWELNALEMSDKIIMYFEPGTKSPISLLELGIYAGSSPDKLIVICPDGFWRKGNVDIVCERYNIKMVNSFEEAVSVIKSESMRLKSLPQIRKPLYV